MDRVPERLSEASRQRRLRKQKLLSAEFLRGPIPVVWMRIAGALGSRAVLTGLALWFRAGIEGRPDCLKLCTSSLKRLGVSRIAGYRGLRSLEQAGLVRVSRQRGKCPVVTICEVENT